MKENFIFTLHINLDLEWEGPASSRCGTLFSSSWVASSCCCAWAATSQARSVNPGGIETCWLLLATEWKAEGIQDSSVPAERGGCWGLTGCWFSSSIYLVLRFMPLMVMANSWLCLNSILCICRCISTTFSWIDWFSCCNSLCWVFDRPSIHLHSSCSSWNGPQILSSAQAGQEKGS